MKKTLFAPLLIATALALSAFAAEDHAPKHGGVVVETKAGDLELVAKPELIVIHVSDHGKPMKLASMRPLGEHQAASRAWSGGSRAKSWVSWPCRKAMASGP